MIVAGDLLASVPLHRAPHEHSDEFTEWIRGHDISRPDGRWLSDRRDRAPLERPAWYQRRDYALPSASDFEEALLAGDLLNIWGNWTSADSALEQAVSVHSALVAPDRVASLLRALKTARNIHDYAIPDADSDLQYNRAGFVFKGWILTQSREAGLDAKDRWSGDVRFPPPQPSLDIVELMRLRTDADMRLWRNGENLTVLSSQVWGILNTQDEENAPEEGSRLQADLAFIRDMLQKLGYDLLVEVQIKRRRRYRHYENQRHDDDKLPSTTQQLFIIKADGSILAF